LLGDAFDVASGFSVLKNAPRRLSDFPGHFLVAGRMARLVFAWFWGSGSSGRVVWGDKTKTRHFSGNLGCVGLQHPQLRHNCATCSYCGCKTAVFSIFAFLADFTTYRLVLQKMAIFVLHTKFYIADRAFFDPIFSFWHKPSKVKNRKKRFCEKTCFLKKVNFAFFCPSRFFVKKSQIEIFHVFFKIVQ
jgi:hypothetical protein